MEKNFRKKFSNYVRRSETKNRALNCKSSNLKNESGITLVALVVTIIVLLILAGVSLSAVFSQDGIFRRAEQATDKHGQAKARETLELALGEAQMQKYEEGLTDEQLTNKINEIGEEIEERETPNISQAIVDGYIFSIDRTVPKILDYLGPADGIIITAEVTQNGNWQNPAATLLGKIKTYSGGTITNVSAIQGETAIAGFSIDGDGRYTISNITTNTTIVITATDSKQKTNSKNIPVKMKVDITAPTVEEVTATVEKMTIKFTATGHDKNSEGQEESGIDYYSYEIISTEDPTLVGIPNNKRMGMFKTGEIVTIEATKEATYTVKVTATDKCNNTSDMPKTASIKTMPIKVTEINIDKDLVYLTASETEKVTVSVLPNNATNKEVEWISNEPSIAQISQDGIITAKQIGTATFTVTSKDNEKFSKTVTVKVGTPFVIDEGDLIPVNDLEDRLTISYNPLMFKLDASGYSGLTKTVKVAIPTGVRSVYTELNELNGAYTCCHVAPSGLTPDELWAYEKTCDIVGVRFIEAGTRRGCLSLPENVEQADFIFRIGGSSSQWGKLTFKRLLLLVD